MPPCSDGANEVERRSKVWWEDGRRFEARYILKFCYLEAKNRGSCYMQSIAHNCALIRFIQFQVSIDNKPEILLINMERHHTRLHMCSNALEQIHRRTMTTKEPNISYLATNTSRTTSDMEVDT